MIEKIIKFEEGFKDRPYYCSEKYPTIGYGFKLGKKNAPLPEFKLPEPVAKVWLLTLIAELKEQLSQELNGLNDERQAILISMAYQMGVEGLRGFKKFLSALKAKDWALASKEMLDSKWARSDSPARAKRHSQVILSGSFFGIYK